MGRETHTVLNCPCIHRDGTLAASGRLRRLRDVGLLEQWGKGAATYYLPGGTLLAALGSPTSSEPLRSDTSDPRPESALLRPEFPALRPEFAALRTELPPALKADFARLGERATPQKLDAFILRLTAWQPLTQDELAALTGRAAAHPRKRNIKRLVTDGRLAYTHPDEPNHPGQRYTSGPRD